MKKMMALVLGALLAALLLTAVAEADVPTGEWYLVEAVTSGMHMNPAELGMSVTLFLNEDGSAKVTSVYEGEEPEEESGTWTQEGNVVTVTTESGPVELTLADGRLSMTIEVGEMIYAQEKPAAAELPQPVAAESEEQFFGVWTPRELISQGVHVDLADAGIVEGQWRVEAGKMTETSGAGDAATVTEYTTEFVDGVLKLTPVDDPELELPPLTLNDDGSISVTVTEDDTDLTLYLRKAE